MRGSFEANGGAHKIYNATVHCLIAKKQVKSILSVILEQVMQENAFNGCKKIWSKV